MIPVLLSCHPADESAGLGGFAAAEMQRAGLTPRLDSHPIDLPARFWPPVKASIANKLRAAAWAVFLTDTVCSDSAALETIAYAAAGAQGTRGQGFPVIALRPGSAYIAVPPSLSQLQSVSMGEHTWAQSVRALAEGRGPVRAAGGPGPVGVAPSGEAYSVTLHHRQQGGRPAALALEFRPLATNWPQFYVAVPWVEAGAATLTLVHGVRAYLPESVGTEAAAPVSTQAAKEGEWAMLRGGAPASRRESYFLFCPAVPSVVRFGVPDGHLQYTVRLRPV